MSSADVMRLMRPDPLAGHGPVLLRAAGGGRGAGTGGERVGAAARGRRRLPRQRLRPRLPGCLQMPTTNSPVAHYLELRLPSLVASRDMACLFPPNSYTTLLGL